jgi:ribosomal protein S18 acetylase RimI-like enzyme
MTHLKFRKATVADIPAIHLLVESVYRGENSRKGWTTEADFLEGQRTDPELLREMFDSANAFFILAFTSGARLVGSTYLEKREGHAYLGMLSVDVLAQNLKVGRRIMTEAERTVEKEWGLKEIRIRVIDIRAELISWYERRGYKLTNEYTEFPIDPRLGTIKVEKLRFVGMKKSW